MNKIDYPFIKFTIKNEPKYSCSLITHDIQIDKRNNKIKIYPFKIIDGGDIDSIEKAKKNKIVSMYFTSKSEEEEFIFEVETDWSDFEWGVEARMLWFSIKLLSPPEELLK